jgi:DNA (cytosine-5)-methyltransferase 1
MGYHYGVVMIDAALFVPQSRERVFVVAIDAALNIPAAIVADRPSVPFHSEDVVKALRRQPFDKPRSQPIWWHLPVPPPHSRILADLLEDARAVKWDAPGKTAEIISMMNEPHLNRLDEDKRAGRLVVRSLNWRTHDEITRWESSNDLIANCLRTGSGGSNIQRLIFVEGRRRAHPEDIAPGIRQSDGLARQLQAAH